MMQLFEPVVSAYPQSISVRLMMASKRVCVALLEVVPSLILL